MIPKIIHYGFLGDKSRLAQFEQYMRSWKTVLTDYEFILWDEKRFDLSSSLWVQEAYEAKKYAFAVDYIRLHAIYHYGGIYLDTDVECVKDLSPLLDTDLLLAHEDPEGNWIESGVFGAIKGHPYIRQCLDWFEGRSYFKTINDFPDYTLPLVWTPIAKAYKPPIPVYSWEYFTAKNWIDGKINKTPHTYCVHHFEGNWLPSLTKKRVKRRQKIYSILGINPVSKALVESIIWFETKYLNISQRLKTQGLKKSLVHYFNKVLRK